MNYKLLEKLQDPEYRKAFVASQINIGIPFQIRALLKSRLGWTQNSLAERTGMRQPSISGLLAPGKTRPNIETLRRIAEAFDCGLIVRFAPFSELAKWSEDFDPESFNVPGFAHDPGFAVVPGHTHAEVNEAKSEAATFSNLRVFPSAMQTDTVLADSTPSGNRTGTGAIYGITPAGNRSTEIAQEMGAASGNNSTEAMPRRFSASSQASVQQWEASA